MIYHEYLLSWFNKFVTGDYSVKMKREVEERSRFLLQDRNTIHNNFAEIRQWIWELYSPLVMDNLRRMKIYIHRLIEECSRSISGYYNEDRIHNRRS